MVSDDPESFADLDGHDWEKVLSNLEKSATTAGHALETAGEKVVKAVTTVVNNAGGEAGAGAGQIVAGLVSGNADQVNEGNSGNSGTELGTRGQAERFLFIGSSSLAPLTSEFSTGYPADSTRLIFRPHC